MRRLRSNVSRLGCDRRATRQLGMQRPPNVNELRAQDTSSDVSQIRGTPERKPRPWADLRQIFVGEPRDNLFGRSNHRLCCHAGRIAGALLGDVVLTRHEIRGLAAGLLDTPGPATGATGFRGWLRTNSEDLGRTYASELGRGVGTPLDLGPRSRYEGSDPGLGERGFSMKALTLVAVVLALTVMPFALAEDEPAPAPEAPAAPELKGKPAVVAALKKALAEAEKESWETMIKAAQKAIDEAQKIQQGDLKTVFPAAPAGFKAGEIESQRMAMGGEGGSHAVIHLIRKYTRESDGAVVTMTAAMFLEFKAASVAVRSKRSSKFESN